MTHVVVNIADHPWRLDPTSLATIVLAVLTGSLAAFTDSEWLYVDHLIYGQWTYVGGEGEGFIFHCAQKGMSPTIARDLHVSCG